MMDSQGYNGAGVGKIASSTINTREKFSSLAKKLLRLLYDSQKKVWRLAELLQESQKIFKQGKKYIEVIAYFEAIGLLTRVSPSEYVYTGFRGISARLMEFEINRSRNVRAVVSHDEVIFQGRSISIKPQLVAGLFFNQLFFGLIFLNGRFTSKIQMEMLVQSFSNGYKDANSKTFLLDILNLLAMLGFIDKNESTDVVSYIGPDFKTYQETIWRKIPEKVRALIVKEEQFFIEGQPENPVEAEPTFPLKSTLNHIPQLSYAILKARNWQFPVKNTVLIIGRASQHLSWEVDLDLPYKGVSRQHAVLLYNYDVKKWEVRCLSRKNLIKVDGERYAFRDKDIWLRDRSIIQIAHERMMFCLVEKDD